MEATDTFATSRWSAEETTGVEVLRFIPAEKLPKAQKHLNFKNPRGFERLVEGKSFL